MEVWDGGRWRGSGLRVSFVLLEIEDEMEANVL